MLPSLLGLGLGLLLQQCAGLALALPSALLSLPGASANGCDTLPSWTIKDLTLKSHDAVGSGGTASLTIANSATGKSEAVTCALIANYRCEIDGTPSDKSLTITLQSNIDVVFVWINEKFTCGGKTTCVLPASFLL